MLCGCYVRSFALLHRFEHLENAVHFESHCTITAFTHGLLCDDTRVDVRFQVCYLLLHVDSVLHDFPLGFLSLDAHFEDFIDDLLEVFNHVVVLRLKVLVRLVDDTDEDLTVVLKRPPECLQVVVHLKRKIKSTS